MHWNLRRRIYLDYAAATPLDKRAFSAMKPFLGTSFGNPSALYQEGRIVKEKIEHARTQIAADIGGHADEIIFTGSGTESNNLAIVGTVKRFFSNPDASKTTPHIITTPLEHPSVLAAIKDMEAKGAAKVTYLKVSNEGLVNPKDVRDAIRPETVLVTIGYANSEIGVVQDIRGIAKMIRNWKKEHAQTYPYFHTDACQAMNYLDTHVERLGVDLMTWNAAKIYGPKGIGILYCKRGTLLAPLIYGGGQEKNMRSGTEDAANIAGCAAALATAIELREKESARLAQLRDALIAAIKRAIPQAEVNGSLTHRLPNNVNISIPGVRSAELVLRMDAKGIACSSKSACKSSDEEASYVIRALGKSVDEATSSIRMTLGRGSRMHDIKKIITALTKSLATMSRAPKLG